MFKSIYYSPDPPTQQGGGSEVPKAGDATVPAPKAPTKPTDVPWGEPASDGAQEEVVEQPTDGEQAGEQTDPLLGEEPTATNKDDDAVSHVLIEGADGKTTKMSIDDALESMEFTLKVNGKSEVVNGFNKIRALAQKGMAAEAKFAEAAALRRETDAKLKNIEARFSEAVEKRSQDLAWELAQDFLRKAGVPVEGESIAPGQSEAGGQFQLLMQRIEQERQRREDLEKRMAEKERIQRERGETSERARAAEAAEESTLKPYLASFADDAEGAEIFKTSVTNAAKNRLIEHVRSQRELDPRYMLDNDTLKSVLKEECQRFYRYLKGREKAGTQKVVVQKTRIPAIPPVGSGGAGSGAPAAPARILNPKDVPW